MKEQIRLLHVNFDEHVCANNKHECVESVSVTS